MHIIYFILSGGKARRMGGNNKLLLSINQHLILDYVWQLMPQHAINDGAIWLNSNPPHNDALQKALQTKTGANYDVPTVSDGEEFYGEGPLAGFLSGLDTAIAHHYSGIITIPSDTPFIPKDFDKKLWQASDNGQNIVSAYSDGRVHPVISFLPILARDALHGYLQAGNRKIMPFFEANGGKICEFQLMPLNDGTRYDSMMNINSPDDLKKAQYIARIMAKPLFAT